MSASKNAAPLGPVLRFADLAGRSRVPVRHAPDAGARAALAGELGLVELAALELVGELKPVGKRDWELKARLTARAVQSCVVTLAPVPAKVDEPVHRRWVADWQEPDGEEVEVPDDVDSEPLGAEIDLAQVAAEALALALPDFPRAAGVELGPAHFTEPGSEAMTDEAAKPFAGLAALRDKLSEDE